MFRNRWEFRLGPVDTFGRVDSESGIRFFQDGFVTFSKTFRGKSKIGHRTGMENVLRGSFSEISKNVSGRNRGQSWRMPFVLRNRVDETPRPWSSSSGGARRAFSKIRTIVAGLKTRRKRIKTSFPRRAAYKGRYLLMRFLEKSPSAYNVGVVGGGLCACISHFRRNVHYTRLCRPLNGPRDRWETCSVKMFPAVRR